MKRGLSDSKDCVLVTRLDSSPVIYLKSYNSLNRIGKEAIVAYSPGMGTFGESAFLPHYS